MSWEVPIPAGYLTISQVAARFTVSGATIYSIINDGGLVPEHKDGRTLIHQDELARFVKEQKRRIKLQDGAGKVYDRVGKAIRVESVEAKS